MLNNLSDGGTSIAGKKYVRDVAEKLSSSDILKLGKTFLKCDFEVESTQPPLRVFKITELMGSRVYLTAPPGDETSVADEQVDDQCMANSTKNLATGGTSPADSHSLIYSITSENENLMGKLAERNEALKKAIGERSNLEYLVDDLNSQLEELKPCERILKALMEDEFQCSICNELLVEAVTLTCSHTFCYYCLQRWKTQNNICPYCRASITLECKTRIIDNIIDKAICVLPDEVQQQRKRLIESRKGRDHNSHVVW
ncbi:E3 ubiquitin-protein ligase RNF8-like isoform X2 [Hetaerina americana]